MILYKTQVYDHLPVSIKKQKNIQSRNEQQEEVYLEWLKQQLVRCQNQLESHLVKYNERINQIQQELHQREAFHEDIKKQLSCKISALEVQNNDLRQKLTMLSRCFKKGEMARGIQNQKLQRLTKIIQQKQAVIKYLEQKNNNLKCSGQKRDSIIPRYSSKTHLHTENQLSIFADRDNNCSISHDKSFAKIKTPSSLTFGDYSMNSVKLYPGQEEGSLNKEFVMKNKRTKTQYIENNQNINHNNSTNPAQKLKNLLNYKYKDGYKDQKIQQNISFADQSRQYRNSTKTIDLSRNYTSNKSFSSINTKNHDKAVQYMRKIPNYAICHSDLHFDEVIK